MRAGRSPGPKGATASMGGGRHADAADDGVVNEADAKSAPKGQRSGDSRKRGSHAGALQGSGGWFDELRVGDTFASALTVTETHIVIGAGLIGDFNPHHVNAEYARGTRFGTPILHGMLTSSIMGAAVGMYFHGTAIAFLEHRTRFLAPVRAGDTVTTTWTITHLVDKPRHAGGVVMLTATAANQTGAIVADGEARIMVSARPAAGDSINTKRV